MITTINPDAIENVKKCPEKYKGYILINEFQIA